MVDAQDMDRVQIPSPPPEPVFNTPLRVKAIEYFCLIASIGTLFIGIISWQDRTVLLFCFAFLGLFIFTLLVAQQYWENQSASVQHSLTLAKADLYSYLLGSSVDANSLKPIREKALQYCQELIADYKRTRRNARNIYYISQLSTIILSGATPILVLLDKTSLDSIWLQWLPVLFPAIASIVTSIATSFPFQETWIAANTAVELLEAEQEEFILGVTAPYRCYNIVSERLRQQKAKQAIENFIIQINTIHLKRVQAPLTKSQEDSKSQEEANAASCEKPPEVKPAEGANA